MIPQFPEFKKIDVDDRAAVESHTHRYPPYSDFNFTSLWAWDTSNEVDKKWWLGNGWYNSEYAKHQ